VTEVPSPSESAQPPAVPSAVERSLEVQVGSLGGFEVRPTRVFLWGGAEREGQRVVALGAAPSAPATPPREREVHAGALEIKTFGSPFMTVALAGVHAVREFRRARRGGDETPAS
jgi:hypothetical protein